MVRHQSAGGGGIALLDRIKNSAMLREWVMALSMSRGAERQDRESKLAVDRKLDGDTPTAVLDQAASKLDNGLWAS